MVNTAHIRLHWKVSRELDGCSQPPTVKTDPTVNSDAPGIGNLPFFSFPLARVTGTT